MCVKTCRVFWRTPRHKTQLSLSQVYAKTRQVLTHNSTFPFTQKLHPGSQIPKKRLMHLFKSPPHGLKKTFQLERLVKKHPKPPTKTALRCASFNFYIARRREELMNFQLDWHVQFNSKRHPLLKSDFDSFKLSL